MPFPQPDRLTAGCTFRGLDVLGDLGGGLSGDVYKVRWKDGSGRIGVLKRYRKWEHGVSADDFRREAHIVADQPIAGWMPRFFELVDTDGELYYLMSYEGPLPDDDELTDEQWFDWILELIGIFENLNDVRHIFHRDVKPRNLRSTDGHPKAIDFGLACRNDRDKPYPHERVGSRDFMAPEIIRSEVYTIKAEIFSTAKSVQAIVPKHIRQALSPALFHATEHGLGERTPSWSVFRAEVKDRRAAYRKEQAEKRKRREFVRALLIAAAALGLVACYYLGLLESNFKDLNQKVVNERKAVRLNRVQNIIEQGCRRLSKPD